jgi:hypothetical protein
VIAWYDLDMLNAEQIIAVAVEMLQNKRASGEEGPVVTASEVYTKCRQLGHRPFIYDVHMALCKNMKKASSLDFSTTFYHL